MNTPLQKAREEKGLTKTATAKKAKTTTMSYCRYESGERVPDAHTAQRIANALDSDVPTLFPLPISL